MSLVSFTHGMQKFGGLPFLIQGARISSVTGVTIKHELKPAKSAEPHNFFVIPPDGSPLPDYFEDPLLKVLAPSLEGGAYQISDFPVERLVGWMQAMYNARVLPVTFCANMYSLSWQMRSLKLSNLVPQVYLNVQSQHHGECREIAKIASQIGRRVLFCVDRGQFPLHGPTRIHSQLGDVPTDVNLNMIASKMATKAMLES